MTQNIKIFSRSEMINRVSYGVLPNEYYISILPTGGPKGDPIFDQSSNVIILVFDDVEQDLVKDKWPDGIGNFIAKAMTIQQADELCAFIKTIPNDATINIHCVEGKSRSVAVASAIENSPQKGNAHVYKLLRDRLHDNS
jgi:predicted protein tyrosine phosphatase